MGCLSSKGTAQEPPPKSASKSAAASSNQTEKDMSNAENKVFQQTMTFLSKVGLFKRLPKAEHPLLAKACIPTDFKAGQVIIKQGDPGAEFFVIKSGEASVSVSMDGESPKKVATLKAGDYFGENALLRDEPRTATITASTAMSTLKITRDKFQELELNEKLQFANRKAVGGAGKRVIQTKDPSAKTDDERKLMKKAIQENENLQVMVPLDQARANQMVDVAWKEEVPAGHEIIKEGDLVADYFYIVQEGCCEVFVSSESEEESNVGVRTSDKVTTVGTVGAGGSFGELALLYLVPRAATVKAKEKTVLWVIDRANFKDILMKVSDEKINEYMTYLNGIDILQPLLAEEKKAVAQALVEMHFQNNEVILQQGEEGSTFYILYEGEVSVVKDGNEISKQAASTKNKTVRYFGERALLTNEPRAATVAVKSETAKALALDRGSFNLLLGPLEQILQSQEQNKTGRISMVGAGQRPQAVKPKGEKIQRRDLVKIGLLGCGGFGSVELWEHKGNGNTYAMKTLSKGFIVQTGMQESVMNEKTILMMTDSAFIIKLYETYRGKQQLHFLLEVALGGELYATYNRKGLHGSERHAKYYVAGTVFAFIHLHERRIIYRDLKPENLLLTEKGHIKLTDMGLAKFVIGKTYTTCGTPDYFAPELIASTGHTNAVDWWTLGILLFELMSGHPPFESPFPMQIYSKVMKGINKVEFPPRCKDSVGDLIRGLLKSQPSERLPMRPGGVQNLKDHKWYHGFNWEDMMSLKLDPPYKPVVKSKKDIANFSARKEDMPKQLEYHDDGSGWDNDFATN